MPEIYRLEGRAHKGKTSLVLTDTHLILEPDADFRAEIEDGLAKGLEGAQKAPGVIGWFVTKMVSFADRMVEKVWEPHSLADVELLIKHDQVTVKFGRLNFGSVLESDPTEAYIFAAKFRDAKEALGRR